MSRHSVKIYQIGKAWVSADSSLARTAAPSGDLSRFPSRRVSAAVALAYASGETFKSTKGVKRTKMRTKMRKRAVASTMTDAEHRAAVLKDTGMSPITANVPHGVRFVETGSRFARALDATTPGGFELGSDAHKLDSAATAGMSEKDARAFRKTVASTMSSRGEATPRRSSTRSLASTGGDNEDAANLNRAATTGLNAEQLAEYHRLMGGAGLADEDE